MVNWLYIVIPVGLFIISLFFEDVREVYGEIWETITDGFTYIISFDWFGDAWEFISGAFENLSEFSIYGLSFGTLAVVLIFFLRGQMIEPFVQYYQPAGRIFWTIATYVTVFVGGYFLGRAFENN